MLTKVAEDLFLKSREAKGLSRETIRWYGGIFRAFAKCCHELPEEPEPIYDFLSSCASGDERRHGCYRALRALYNFLYRRAAFPNPMKFVDPPKRKPKQPRPLTPEELDQLLSYPHRIMVKAALLFLADTGARVGELRTLGLNDLTEMPWGYFARITGKTGTRLVPMSFETYNAISRFLPFNYSRSYFSRIISWAFDDARVRGSGINLRHTFGTYWTGDMTALKQIMGHTKLSTTLMYRQLQTEYLAQEHRKYSPLKTILSMTRRLDM